MSEQIKKYKVGDLVTFTRLNIVNDYETVVSAIVPISKNRELENKYLIEFNNGWEANEIRVNQFDLDENKKYLFVLENELTLITN